MKTIRAMLLVLYLVMFAFSSVYAAEMSDAVESLEPPEVEAAAVTLMDAATGLVLYEKAQHEENYPASITKVMTALLTLEMCEDLNEPLTFSRNAVYSLPRDASHIAMDEGETLTLYDALHGLLLASANEVANALAEHIAGSVEEFTVLMNKRAAALGAAHTRFENPSGLFDANHVTTAYDMALIMREAVRHDVFMEIISTLRYDIPPTEKQPEVRALLNTNRFLQPGEFFNEWVKGGKTGFTDEAQYTLVNYAEKDGRELIVTALHGGRPGVYVDTAALLDYGFALPYAEQIVFDSAAYTRSIPVYAETDGSRVDVGSVTVQAKKDLSFSLPANFDKSAIRYELTLPESVAAPLALDDVLGTVVCYAQTVKVGEAALRATRAVPLPAPAQPDAAANAENAAVAQEIPAATEAPAEEPAAYVWDYDYITTLALPLALSLITLVASLIVFLRKRKRRAAQILSFDRYARYDGNLYRYK